MFWTSVIVVFAIILFKVWMRMERSVREHVMWALTLMLVLLTPLLCACSKGDAAVAAPSVHWGASYAPGYVFLEVDVRGDDHVSGLTLVYDREVSDVHYVDQCIAVQTPGSLGSTWAASPMGGTCTLSTAGDPLLQGRHTFVIPFYVRRVHVGDEVVDYTPVVTDCRVR